MFASCSKTRNVAVKLTPTAAGTATKSTVGTVRQQGRGIRSNVSANANTNVNGQQQTPHLRSKFTERRLVPVVSNNTTRLRNMRMDNNQGTTTSGGAGTGIGNNASGNKLSNEIRRSVRGVPSNTAARAMTRQWKHKDSSKNANDSKSKSSGDKIEEEHFIELGIQTNEAEILNHDLIIGDIKLLLPSTSLVNEIDRQRQEARKRTLLNSQRKFEEHSEKQEEHLTDLKEFLEKAVISRRARKSKITLEVDKKYTNFEKCASRHKAICADLSTRPKPSNGCSAN